MAEELTSQQIREKLKTSYETLDKMLRTHAKPWQIEQQRRDELRLWRELQLALEREAKEARR